MRISDLLAGVAFAGLAWSGAALAQQRTFNVASQPATKAIPEFARQAGIQIIAPSGKVGDIQTPLIQGQYDTRAALAVLLRGTGLRVVADEGSSITLGPVDGPISEASEGPLQTRSSSNSGSEIVVTAQRRVERLQDVPISATVTTGLALANANITSAEQLATRLPNVKITEGNVTDRINIRGIGSGENNGFEQSVATFVDGIYRSRSKAGVRAALFDIDRIEVLRGPQTTFFGNNAIAGALNITTRKPGKVLEGNASALYAPAFKKYDFDAGISVPVSETLAVRVAGKVFGQDGWIQNDSLHRKEPRERNFLARGSLRWDPSDVWHTDLRVDYGRKKRRGDGRQTRNCPPDPAIYGPNNGLCLKSINFLGGSIDDKLDRHSNNADLSGDNYRFMEIATTSSLKIGEHTLTSTTGYFHHNDLNAHSTFALPLPGAVAGAGSGVSVAHKELYSSFSQELRLDSPTDQFLSYSLGAYYSQGKLSARSYLGFYFDDFGSFIDPSVAGKRIAVFFPLNQKDRTISTFGAATLNFTDRLKLNLGLRYSVVRKIAHSTTVIGTGGYPLEPDNFVPFQSPVQEAGLAAFGADPGDFPSPRRTDKHLMPSASLQYKLTSTLTSYVSYSNGFKAGGYGQGTTRDTFDPEKVDAYEAGIKGTLFDRNLFFSLAVFTSKYKDLQESIATVVGGIALLAVDNVASARSRGVEFGTSYRLNDMFSLRADVAYLDATYLSFASAECTQAQQVAAGGAACTQSLSGRPRSFAPKWSGNAGVSVTVPLNESLEIRFDPSVYFTSAYNESSNLDPLLDQKGYAKLDARIAVGPANRNWEVAVIGKNITDKTTAAYGNITGATLGTTIAIADPPREIAMQASFKF